MNEIEKNKIIFLDCDGVINNDAMISDWISRHGESKESMEMFRQRYCLHNGEDGYVVPELVERLKNICNRTECKIVWSSSWRENYLKRNPDTGDFYFNYVAIRSLWVAKGFPVERFIDCTPCENMTHYSYVPRGLEIQDWIDKYKDILYVGKCAILDDNEDAGYGIKDEGTRFFQTSFSLGLTKDIADNVVEWLNN